MIGLVLKWGFVLALVIALVFGLSSKQVRTPLFGFLKKFKWQIIIVAIVFVAILQLSLLGT